MRFTSTLQILLPLVILGTTANATNNDNPDPVSDVERCRRQGQNEKLSTLEGIVGIGFDNLRNVPMAAVLSSTFLNCRTTPDRQYLIPDNMEVLPVKRSELDRMANYYEHFKDYFKSTSENINLEAGFAFAHFTISGSFSAQHQEVKQKFCSEKSSLFRTTLLYHAYKVICRPGTSLNPTFKTRLLEINDAVSKNLTRLARYLSQMTIRDFGTHVITQADVGATIIQEDFVDSKVDFSQSSSLDELKVAASVGFFGFLKMGSASAGITVKQTTKEQFSSALRHSQVRTKGGPDVNRLLTATGGDSNSSQASLLVDDLVALDRSGVPLFTIINQDNLPELRQPNLQQVQIFIKNATLEYYGYNTRRGCMDPGAENFDFQANVDDDTCNQPYNNYTFGGVYQTCEPLSDAGLRPSAGWRCNDLTQANGATGTFTCPENYEPVKLFSVVHQFPDRHETVKTHKCRSCYWVATCCDDYYHDVVYQDRVRLTAYWCNATAPQNISVNQGVMFGGLFVNGQLNPFSGSPNCPGHFVPYRLGLDLTVCLSRDYQLDHPFSIKFGGFFSCQTPTLTAKCPKGYSQHLAMIAESCDIFYCVRPESFMQFNLATAVLPPYGDTSGLISNETSSVIYAYRNNQFLFKLSIQDALKELNNFTTDSSASFLRSSSMSKEQTFNNMSEEEALHEWINKVNVPNLASIRWESVEANQTSTSWRSVENKSTLVENKTAGLSTVSIVSIIGLAIGAVFVIAFVGIKKYKRMSYGAI